MVLINPFTPSPGQLPPYLAEVLEQIGFHHEGSWHE